MCAFTVTVVNRENEDQWAETEVSQATSLADIKANIATQFSIPASRIEFLNSQSRPLVGDTIQDAGLAFGDTLYYTIRPEQTNTTTTQTSVEIKQVAEKESKKENKDILPDTIVMAIIEHNLAAVKTHFANGGNVEAKDSYFGETALITATVANSSEIFTLLLEKGADINSQNKKRETVLMYAVRHKTPKIKSLLLEKGVKVNVQDEDGKTALLEALLNKDFDTITELVKHGADETIKDKKQKSVSDHAKQKQLSKEFNEALLKARRVYME